MDDAPAQLWHSVSMAKPLDILIIEDDPSINEVVAAHLARQGHHSIQAYSGSEGLMLFENCTFDVVVTDLMLPGATGEEVVGALREKAPAVPIIVISARITPADKVELLKLGADDYLTKPFDLEELSARIDVQIRHRNQVRAQEGSLGFAPSAPGAPGYAPGALSAEPAEGLGGNPSYGGMPSYEEAPLQFREWTLFPEARVFTVEDAPLSLTRTEFNILELLMSRPAKVFTKQELFELVWGEPYSVDDSTVNVHVSNLRRKLKPTGTDAYLQTVWGLGYKLASF